MPDSIRVVSTAVRIWRFARGRLPFLLFLGLAAGAASGAGERRWPPAGVPVDDLVSPVFEYADGSKPWPVRVGKSNVREALREERPIERLIVKYHDEDARSFSVMTGLHRLGALAERSPVSRMALT